jgi:hypothetical protein
MSGLNVLDSQSSLARFRTKRLFDLMCALAGLLCLPRLANVVHAKRSDNVLLVIHDLEHLFGWPCGILA